MAKVKALLAKGLAELCSYMKKYTAALGDLASATADGPVSYTHLTLPTILLV